MTFNPTIIAEPKIEFRQELSHGICWLEWFDFEVFLSTPGMSIYPGFRLLAKRLSLLKVVCGPKWMAWIPVFWVLAMHVVQSSCFSICFPPHIFHSNYLPMTLCLCWIRGTGEIGLLRVDRFFVGSILRWWCTRNIVFELIINWQLVDGHWGAPTVVKPWWLRVILAGRW